MDRVEKLLAAKLLTMAADKFTNHGCNDFDLRPFFKRKEDRQALMKKVYGPEEYTEMGGDSRDYDIVEDWILMRYFARELLNG